MDAPGAGNCGAFPAGGSSEPKILPGGRRISGGAMRRGLTDCQACSQTKLMRSGTAPAVPLRFLCCMWGNPLRDVRGKDQTIIRRSYHWFELCQSAGGWVLAVPACLRYNTYISYSYITHIPKYPLRSGLVFAVWSWTSFESIGGICVAHLSYRK